MTIDHLTATIDSLRDTRPRVLVAIDGPCASGKTTLANWLGRHYGAPVFHMDDFFLQPHQRTPERLAQPGGNVDAERFLAEILTPLREGRDVTYQPYSCQTQTLKQPVEVPAASVAFIEGAYSLHPLLEAAYDLRVLTQIAPDVQRQRILERNGPEKLRQFEETWIPYEQNYFAETRILDRCDVRLDSDWTL